MKTVRSRESATISWLLIAALVSMLIGLGTSRRCGRARRPRPSGRRCAISYRGAGRRRSVQPDTGGARQVRERWRRISAMLSEMSRIREREQARRARVSRMKTTRQDERGDDGQGDADLEHACPGPAG